MNEKNIINEVISDKTVIQAAAKIPKMGMKIRFNPILRATVKIESHMTSLKYFSVESKTCTPGVAININGIDKASIFITSIDCK